MTQQSILEYLNNNNSKSVREMCTYLKKHNAVIYPNIKVLVERGLVDVIDAAETKHRGTGRVKRYCRNPNCNEIFAPYMNHQA